jgi:GTP-binding protein
MKIIDAKFLTSAVDPSGWPPDGPPEVAFAGRSNVGKSSMINGLCQRRRLVRVSGTPGRTRTLNFFEVLVEDETEARYALRLCDLPGYGFAKASKAERQKWREMIGRYLEARPSLRAVVCIVDANVGPTEDDQTVVPLLFATGRAAIVAATKIDKLPKHRRIPRASEIERALGQPRGSVIGVSPTAGIHLDELWEKILKEAYGVRKQPI